ncbi:unnamed protein product, partial [Rotaria sp. Silwood1]
LHETVALEILVRLLEKPIDDSIILVIGFLKEYGQKLLKDSPNGLDSIFTILFMNHH